jgi:hypothetical protein
MRCETQAGSPLTSLTGLMIKNLSLRVAELQQQKSIPDAQKYTITAE